MGAAFANIIRGQGQEAMNMFAEGFQAVGPQHGPPQKAPPASYRVLNSLPMVRITADDLLEAANKECLICLEEQELGGMACKLPCGHIYHKECLVMWLKKQCTCPVCRFELETDDSAYEQQRKKRMMERKLRFRRDELDHKPVSQLRDISKQLNVNITDCIDKKELVDRLVASGKIVVTEGVPPIEITEQEFNSKSVLQLRHLLLSFGLADDGAIEKFELRQKLIESGRVVITASAGDDKMKEQHQDTENWMEVDSTGISGEVSDSIEHEKKEEVLESSAKAILQKQTDNTGNSYDTVFRSGENVPHSDFTFSNIQLEAVNVVKAAPLHDLRVYCHQQNISIAGCIDKTEVIECIISTRRIEHCARFLQELKTAPVIDSDKNQSSNSDGNLGSEPKFPLRMTKEELDSVSTPELRKLFMASGIADEQVGTLDSFSLKDRLISEGKVILEESRKLDDSDAQFSENNVGSNDSEARNGPSDEKFTLSRELLNELSLRELKSIMEAYHLSTDGCLERRDLIDRIEACPSVVIVD